MTCSLSHQIVYRVLLLSSPPPHLGDIYNYIPETNHVSRVYSVAALPYLQFLAACFGPSGPPSGRN